MMSSYEFVFILKDQSEETLGKVQGYLTALEGKVNGQDAWGKKTFSYPIKKLPAGAYFDWQIELDTQSFRELCKKLDYDEDVLRYLIFKN